MPDAPPDTSARLHAMYRVSPTAAVDQLRTLLKEIVDFVEAHAPDVAPVVIAATRRGIDQHPRAYEPPG